MRTKVVRLFLLVLVAFLFGGCAATRKTTSISKEKSHVVEDKTETTEKAFTQLIDSARTEGLEVTYTKIEYFAPEIPELREVTAKVEPKPEKKPDNPVTKTERKPQQREKPPPTGAIKSIETYTVSQQTQATANIKTTEDTKIDTDIVTTTESDRADEMVEEAAPDPYRWRYIFRILLILVAIITAAYFWLRKTKVATSIFSIVKKIFT